MWGGVSSRTRSSMAVFNKRKDKEVDFEKLWAMKMEKNPSLKRLNPKGSAADMMQAMEYDWDLHYKKKMAEPEGGDDPNWERMFMTESEDDSIKKEYVTQQYPYLKREMIRLRKKKGENFTSLVLRYQPLLVPEDNNDFRKGAYRIQKEYAERGGCGPTEAEDAALSAIAVYEQVMDADKGPGGTKLRTSEDACWAKCVNYTTAYVEDVRVTPGSAEGVADPQPGRDYAKVLREDFGGPGDEKLCCLDPPCGTYASNYPPECNYGFKDKSYLGGDCEVRGEALSDPE